MGASASISKKTSSEACATDAVAVSSKATTFVDFGVLTAKLEAAQKGESTNSSALDPEVKKKNFAAKRKAHYNEYQRLLQFRRKEAIAAATAAAASAGPDSNMKKS